MVDIIRKEEFKTVPISQIICEDRFREDMGDIGMLAHSIKKDGLLHPLVVMANEDGTYRLLAGGRRYAACQKAGLENVSIHCYYHKLNPLEMRFIELMENIERKDMTWQESSRLKAEIYRLQVAMKGEKISTLPDAPGVSQNDIADMIGVSPATVSRDIKLADAIEIFPELNKAKNKSEAFKMLDKLEENVLKAELAKRVSDRAASTPLEHIHRNLINQYILGDFLASDIPDNTINFVEMDPPYAIDLKEIKRNIDLTYNKEAYNEVGAEDYGNFLYQSFSKCYKAMSENSWIVVWHAKEWLPQIIDLLSAVGFICTFNSTGIWYKGNVGQTNNPSNYLASCYEQFVYARKGEPSIVSQGRSNVFNFKPVTGMAKIHPTERPVEMIQDVLQTFCWQGARIMVPFLGSGNTLLAASNLGMSAFGWDLSQEYKDAYTLRVVEGRPTSYRSYKEV